MRIKKTLLIILSLLFAAVFVFSGVVLALEFSKRERDDETFNELADLVLMLDPYEESSGGEQSGLDDENSSNESESEQGTDDTITQKLPHKRNLFPVIEKNNDCVGWVYIEDTQVNYPVMYTPYEAQKYIDKSFDLKSSSYGVPFIEAKCTPNGDHVVIYGHNMKNGSMFAVIKKYRDKEFFDSHPVIEYETTEGCRSYTVIAMCELHAKDKWYSYLNTSDSEEFESQISRILTRAVQKSDIEIIHGKKLLTLSTCQGGDDNTRRVLIAIEN